MSKKIQLKLLKRSDEKILEDIIINYTSYVSTVVSNTLGSFSERNVVEEITADVFFALWKKRFELKSENIKAWFGTTARNKAKDHIRSSKLVFEELSEDIIICSDDNVFDRITKEEQRRVISSALLEITENQRDVLVRYYFYNQSVKQISEQTGENLETVKSRLSRGRSKLKGILQKGGYFNEEEHK